MKQFLSLLLMLLSSYASALKWRVEIDVVCDSKGPPVFVVKSKKYDQIKSVEVRNLREEVIWLSLNPKFRTDRNGFLFIKFGDSNDNEDRFERPRQRLKKGRIYKLSIGVPGASGS